jgi:hypothetical protein
MSLVLVTWWEGRTEEGTMYGQETEAYGAHEFEERN